MKSFFTTVIGFFLGILEYFVKRFGIQKTAIIIQIAVMTTYRAFQVIAIAYFINFLFRLWTLTKDLIHDLNNFGVSVAGISYGIANSTLISSFWGLIHASGFDDAFMTAGALGISLLSTYFVIQTYKIVLYVYRDIIDLINQLLVLFTR